MYRSHFNLNEMPFSLTPDTQFFFNQATHNQALNTLVFALENGEGFVKVVGEVGTGKTILCRKLLNTLGEKFVAAYIPNPFLTPEELRIQLAEEIGVEVDPEMHSHELLSAINKRLIELVESERHVVLVIDEAQALPRETLESLRLLSNLETEKQKLLQVVLFGQPELDELLGREDLRQLRQRIVYQEYLKPCSNSRMVRYYLQYRLAAAGYQQGSLFSRVAEKLLFVASRGVPRLINVLAHKAMVSAWGRGDHRVTTYHVAKAVMDTEGSSSWGKFLSLRWYLMWPVLGAVSLALAFLWPVGQEFLP